MTEFITQEFTVSFPSIFETAKFQGEDTGKYQIDMLFDSKEEAEEIFRAVEKTIKTKWKDKVPSNLRMPIGKAGEQKAFYDKAEFKGKYLATAKSRFQPTLVDKFKNEILTNDPNKDGFYAGCRARAYLSVFAYDKMGKGVSIEVQGIQKLADGEPLGNARPKADDMFESVESDNPDNYSEDIYE